MLASRGRIALVAKTARGSKVAKTRPDSARFVTWLLMGGIIAVGALLRGMRLGEAPGGFHVYNEFFYLQLAQREEARGLLEWFYRPLDVNNPPLFNAIFSTVLRLGGSPVVSGRLISLVSGLAAIVFVFLLGRLLFDERTGLVAAAALAVMPGVVLVNHNIQVDSLFVALTLGGVFFYVRSARYGGMGDAIIGGVLLGLGMLTKQPALLVLPALAVWRSWAHGGFAWLRERRSWVFAATTLCVGGLWYVLELAVEGQRLMGAMVGTAARPEMSKMDATFWSHTFGSEIMWMAFPLAAVLAIIGVFLMIARQENGDRFVLVFLVLFLVYFIGLHKHVYYLLPTTPFIALAIGRACMGAFDREYPAQTVRIVGVSVLLVAMAFGSIMMLSGQKWGRWSPTELKLTPGPGFARVHLYYEPRLDNYFWALPRFTDPSLSATSTAPDAFVELPKTPGVEDLYLASPLYTPEGARVPARESLTETWVRPVIFGYAIGQRWETPSGTQIFSNMPWTAEKIGPLLRFGFYAIPAETPYAIYAR
jgi:hypothetical protein